MGNHQSINIYDKKENISLINSNLKKLPFSPPPENQIKYLYLSGNNILSLSDKLKNLILIDLSDNKFGSSLPPKVASSLSSYSNLKSLYLTKNQLENFDNFENGSLETMFLSQNRFQELPNQFLSKFPLLRTLYFECNFLRTLSNQTSEFLVTLSLSLNCIRNLDASTLNFPKLTILNLSKNDINILPNNLSKSCPYLTILNLSDNFITEVPDGDSVFPKTLKELDLSNNSIEKVPTSITSLPKLSILNIENNKITKIPQLNPSLEKLNASNNKIETIENQELNFLNEIRIDNNELTDFPTEIKFPKLTSIYLHHNKITDLDFSSIPTNNFLIQIDISFNFIEKVPKELFECFPNLMIFSAFFNKITSIPSEISNCSRLTNLEISFNPIKKLPKLPRSLAVLSASNCQIESIDANPFVDPPQADTEASQTENPLKCRKVDLSGNELESFSTFSGIEYLNLSQNKIKKMPEINSNLRVLDLSMNLLESNENSMPQFISGPYLADVNLSHNKLTILPQFQSVPLLQYVELSGNKIEGSFDVTNFTLLERVDISETGISIIGENGHLNEIIFSNRKIDSNLNKYVNLNIQKSGYSEILGERDKMEDSIVLRDDLNLFAVCDGHGGPETAKFASIAFSNLFGMKISNEPLNFEKAKEFFLEIYQKVEIDIQKNKLEDGSTLCLAFIAKNDSGKRKIVTAHLGDARALIVRSDGKSRELTKDHKPSLRSEFDRIHKNFGYLSKDNRVDGRLAVARSLGDFEVFGVGREPELNEFDIDENDKYLVICCDGVFDVLSNDDVAKIAVNSSSTKEAAFKIRNAAFGCMSYDNISAIVVDLSI